MDDVIDQVAPDAGWYERDLIKRGRYDLATQLEVEIENAHEVGVEDGYREGKDDGIDEGSENRSRAIMEVIERKVDPVTRETIRIALDEEGLL